MRCILCVREDSAKLATSRCRTTSRDSQTEARLKQNQYTGTCVSVSKHFYRRPTTCTPTQPDDSHSLDHTNNSEKHEHHNYRCRREGHATITRPTLAKYNWFAQKYSKAMITTTNIATMTAMTTTTNARNIATTSHTSYQTQLLHIEELR